jgi:beta-1,2-mannobiose phosphorylase / 1,2-beta-oligomannan phosphorylase
MEKILISFVLILQTFFCFSQQAMDYNNLKGGDNIQRDTLSKGNIGWVKCQNSPVLGKDIGSIYDVCVIRNQKGVYQMYYSWFEGFGIALSESKDGLKWTKPSVCFENNTDSNCWEQEISNPNVLQKAGVYHMWYTGLIWDSNAVGRSYIGYAVSIDGKKWTKESRHPVLSPNVSWEKENVLRPHVIWDQREKLFKMWYSGGDKFNPNAIGYATSKDGVSWEKYKNNPIFVADSRNKWEQSMISECQVIKRKNDYLMIYTGYSDSKHSQIGMARSKDGITNWEWFKDNPIIKHSSGANWDSEAVYKPWLLSDPKNNRWLLYYNGRSEVHGDKIDEQIGVCIHSGIDLGF